MTKYGRRDANHTSVVEALRGVGASVLILADVGDGCPDLLIGFRGTNLLLEIKDGRKPPSKRKLTPAEQKFHANWRGTVYTVFDETDAVNVIDRMTR